MFQREAPSVQKLKYKRVSFVVAVNKRYDKLTLKKKNGLGKHIFI